MLHVRMWVGAPVVQLFLLKKKKKTVSKNTNTLLLFWLRFHRQYLNSKAEEH